MWEAFRDFLEDESITEGVAQLLLRPPRAGECVGRRAAYSGRGFHADTMHMARLWDSSRKGQGLLPGSPEQVRPYFLSYFTYSFLAAFLSALSSMLCMTEVDVRPGKEWADVARTAAEWCMAMDVRSAPVAQYGFC